MDKATIVRINADEHRQELDREMKESGLYYAVKNRLDEIVRICNESPYITYSSVIGYADDILTMIQLFGERYGSRKIREGRQ